MSTKENKRDTLDCAIAELYDLANHERIKRGMWEWLKVTVCENYSTEMDSNEKAFLLILYERLEAVVDAGHQTHKMNKKAQKNKKHEDRTHSL